MKTRIFKQFSYGLYLVMSIGLLILLIILRNQVNWIAGGLRELFTALLIGITSLYLLITLLLYLRSKSTKTLVHGLIGIIPCLAAIPFFQAPLFNDLNELNEKVETVELTYIAWACDCANWATKEDLENYAGNNQDSLARLSIFIEPENQSLALPDTLGYNNDILKFTGQFYINKGFPQGYRSFENPVESRVFRYSAYEVVKSNYREYQDLKTKTEE